MHEQTGRLLILIGLSVTALGIGWYLLGDRMGWMGRLPGDIRIAREGFRFHFPITTMVLLSILASAVLWLLRKISG